MFEGWDSFFLMIGSAGAGLIGLLFVVVTLTSGIERSTALRGTDVFLTPTVFHFGVVLVISAMALAPGLSTATVGAVIAASAITGLIYVATVAVRIRRGVTPEPPHWSDLWCYGVAPGAIYLGLGAAAAAVWASPANAGHATAFVLLALLLVAIRNAWDLVTWLAPRKDAP
jgi:hypothetical protein